jgi:hypothetical protein
MAPELLVSHPHVHTGRLGAGDAVFGDDKRLSV